MLALYWSILLIEGRPFVTSISLLSAPLPGLCQRGELVANSVEFKFAI